MRLTDFWPELDRPNRAFIEKSVQRRNKGLKAGSVRAYVNALQKADAILDGRQFASASPDELAGLIGTLRTRCSERYVATLAIHLRTCWAKIRE